MTGIIRVSPARVAAAALLLSIVSGGAAQAAEPYGTWVRPSTGTQVNFYACSSKLCARITAVKDETRKNTVGTVIMKGAAKSGDSTWKGDLLNTENGKTYSGVVTLESANALNLKGCVAMVVCSGETWQRVK
jgi:uncharacterized protein (DUF2147 family)